MCGIAGIWALKTRPEKQQLEAVATGMAARIIHRGPDDGGVWADAPQGIALSHRRLSIIDLSAHGHQPMLSASGRYVLSYNGEIYNFKQLRAQLDYPWQSESDTEVILAAIEAWGLEKALQQFNGMFAFALWDKEQQTLTLARDKIGEKPLYYGMCGGDLLFASELKAFRAVPGFVPSIDRTALTQFMRYSYVPAPRSIYEGVAKLKPAHYVVFDGKTEPQEKPYWSMAAMALHAAAKRSTANEEELTNQLEEKLKQAIGLRMISDVPLGAFLSGGIDSSTIVALMQAQSSRAVKTFSIGFENGEFDEAPHAKAVAQHLGTEHTELYVSAQQALEVIPKLPTLYDEPFADSSQIPTYLVSQLAREHVTVALSGDAGDEIFGGYNRYIKAPQIWKKAAFLPQPLRQAIAFYAIEPVLGAAHKLVGLPYSVFKLSNYARKLSAKDAAGFYRALCSQCLAPEDYVQGGNDAKIAAADAAELPFAEWMMLQDSISYLPDDILTKVDRAAMGVSLETRVPLLDPEIMQFAWSLPFDAKIRGDKGKHLLREVLYRHVPRELIDRPKAGFALPLAEWLRGDLKQWAGDLLSPDLLHTQGYFCADKVQQTWQQHQSGARDRSGVLWNILMFQSWLQEQRV